MTAYCRIILKALGVKNSVACWLFCGLMSVQWFLFYCVCFFFFHLLAEAYYRRGTHLQGRVVFMDFKTEEYT